MNDGLLTFVRNVGTRYAAIIVQALLGVVVLPINLHYLGPSAYGLWMLTAALTSWFTVVDLGYGSSVVKFVAEYRAKKDPRGLNEILSTLFTVFLGVAVTIYLLACLAAVFMPALFKIDASQVQTGRTILLIIAANVSLHTVFGVYGGVVNGFQRYYLNNVIGTVAGLVTAAVNVIVLWMGYGLVELVAATTLARVWPYFLYRRNAHQVFPELQLRVSLFRRERLREVTGFSAYVAVIDWSTRLNYAFDTFVLGMFMSTGAVAIYAVGQRLAEALFRVTNQMHVFLFPAVVHSEALGERDRQRRLLVEATRLQLAVAVGICGSVAAVADTLIPAWIQRSGFEQSVVVTQMLAYVVMLRAWMAMPSTVLKGTGRHKYVARASALCALANVLLSIVLVKTLGLPGVVLGTALPVTVLAAAVIFPASCRVVNITTWRGYREVVWPAAWPAVAVIAALYASRGLFAWHLVMVLAQVALGVLAYAALFFAAGLERDQRRWFTQKFGELWKRRSQLVGFPALKSRPTNAV